MSTNAEKEALALKLEAAIQMRDHARSERDALLAENERYKEALRQVGEARSFRGPGIAGETVEAVAGFAREALAGENTGRNLDESPFDEPSYEDRP